LSKYDIIITATNAGEVLISNEDVKNACSQRKEEKQIYIDLSVPRNIYHGVRMNEKVNLITIDDLEDIINKNAARRMNSGSDAFIIIDEKVKEFYNWYRNRSLRPVINAITENIRHIHNEELNGYSNSYNEDTLNAVEQCASRLTQKYIRSIIKNLREINEKGETIESLDAIKELFIFDNKK
jgi:glutamyl-tRNA reductase